MYCMHCGEQIPDNSRFCKYCGKLVAEDEIRTVNAKTEKSDEDTVNKNIQAESSAEEVNMEAESGGSAAGEKISDPDSVMQKEAGESSAESMLSAAKEKTEKESETEIIDDYLFEHISAGKKVALFIGAVLLTAIVAVVVFACFFPELI